MKSLLALFLTMATAASIAQPSRSIQEPLNPIPSSYFEVAKDSPIPSWGELTRLIETSSACLKMARKVPLCDRASEEISSMLLQTLAQVMLANIASNKKGFANVCDAYAEKLVANKQFGPQASYALLLMDAHMKAAKPMYGGAVDSVPLYRILYNAMADENPCAK
jgi:hypothetical protein